MGAPETEEQPQAGAQQAQPQQEGQQPAGGTPQEGQPDEQLREEGLRALQRERDRAKKAEQEREALRTRLKEYEDRGKSDAEKQAEALAEAKTRAEKLEAENLRLRVLAQHAIPSEYADLVHGSDEESLTQSAKKLQSLLEKKSPQPVNALGKSAPKSGTSIKDQLQEMANNGDRMAGIQAKLIDKLGK